MAPSSNFEFKSFNPFSVYEEPQNNEQTPILNTT